MLGRRSLREHAVEARAAPVRAARESRRVGVTRGLFYTGRGPLEYYVGGVFKQTFIEAPLLNEGRRPRTSAASAPNLLRYAGDHRKALARRADFLRPQERFCHVCKQPPQRRAYRGVDPSAARSPGDADCG